MNEEVLESMVGTPIEVTDEHLASCRAANDYFPLMRALFNEATRLLTFASAVMHAEPGYFPRNQAICVGLLVRMSKFMVAALKLTEEHDRGEVVQALARCVMESAINLRFLLKVDSQRFYDNFVARSLGPERELVDLVNRNIKNRDGRRLVIEERMLDTVEEKFRQSGVEIEQVEANVGDWSGGLKERVKALDMEDAYVGFARLPSHAIHGTWVDLLQYHLLPKGDGFEANYDWAESDGELFLGISLLALQSAREYLKVFLADDDVAVLDQRIESLQERFARVANDRDDFDLVT